MTAFRFLLIMVLGGVSAAKIHVDNVVNASTNEVCGQGVVPSAVVTGPNSRSGSSCLDDTSNGVGTPLLMKEIGAERFEDGRAAMSTFLLLVPRCIVYSFFAFFVTGVLIAHYSLFLLLVLWVCEKYADIRDAWALEGGSPPSEWILFENVYDLRLFMPHHPGGSLVLEQCQGTDCTAIFKSYHSLRTPYLGQLEKYRVRRARSQEAPLSAYFNWKDTPKYDAMRAVAREYFKDKSIKAPAWAFVWYAFWMTVLVAGTWRWIVFGEAFASVAMGCAMWYGCTDLVHYASHMAVFESVNMNLLAAHVAGMWTTNTPSWVRQHNMLHHVYTNLPEDPDLHHFHFWYDEPVTKFAALCGFTPWSAWRLTEHTPMRSDYVWWKVYLPFYSCFSTLAVTIIEPPYVFLTRKFMDCDTRISFAPGELAIGWLQYLTVMAALLYTTWAHGVVVSLTPYMVNGAFFYITSQVSHANESSCADHKTKDGKGDWAVHQIETTRGEYNCDSTVAMLLSQGLNLQSVHHVFPAIHWGHYHKIHGLIWAAAGERREPKNFWDIVLEHWSFVSRLNAGESPSDVTAIVM